MIAESLKMNTAEDNRKLHNLQCQMNNKLKKNKNKNSRAGADNVELCPFNVFIKIYFTNVHEPYTNLYKYIWFYSFSVNYLFRANFSIA